MIQKQRRDARKKEREAREAEEEAEKRRLVEAEAIESAKRVEEAQKLALKAAIGMKDSESKDEDIHQAVNPAESILSEFSPSSHECLPTRSKFSEKDETLRRKLRLNDGNVDKASVITENMQSYQGRFSTSTAALNLQDSSSVSIMAKA